MTSLSDLPIDVVGLIARRAGVAGWIALCRVCRRFSALAFNARKTAMLKFFTKELLFDNGTRQWCVEGKLHRDGDEPAEIWANGSRSWCKHGKLHRDGDEPARIWADGSRSWWKHGQLHRDGDEPAIIESDGTQCWYKHGDRHRDGDKPAEIWANGTRSWYMISLWMCNSCCLTLLLIIFFMFPIETMHQIY